MPITGQDLVKHALNWDGHDYVYGDKTDEECDCSGLIYLTCKELGVIPEMPDGSWEQYQFCKDHGTLIPQEQAIKTPGALGFLQTENEHHVVMFQGKQNSEGTWLTMECRGRNFGCGQFSAERDDWTACALVPGVTYA
jgi:cell wall-associated NlpC family hydrolase